MRIFDRCFKFNYLTGCLATVVVLMLVGQTHANELAKATLNEKSGMLSHIITNCGNPNHKGPQYIPVLIEATSHNYTELDVSAVDISGIEPGSYVKVRGALNIPLKNDPLAIENPVFRITDVELDVQAAAAAAAGKEANAPASTTSLKCLLLFATTLDQTNYPASKIADVENMLFSNSSNVSNAIRSASYDYYTIEHGDTVLVDLNINASDTSYSSMGTAMRNEASSMGVNLGDYDRILHFCPQGTLSIPTAYGSKPGSYTWYSYGWSGGLLDGFVHELGHNFGFSHAGDGGNQYGDEACVMGYSHSGNNTATYSAPKKAQKGWYDDYPGSFTSLTNDATFDIYPQSINPDVTPGMRTVQIDGTTYYASYRRNLTPYGWCRRSEDRDRIIIQTQSGSGSSTREGRILPGSTHTAGTTDIIFERYVDSSKEVATVSFDLDDGNAKPVASNQFLTVKQGQTMPITLTGSDADGDSLIYTKITDPSDGSLTGSEPTLSYTAPGAYLGTTSFEFKVSDGKISSFATITITVEANAAPIADDQLVGTDMNAAVGITLTATDPNGDAVTYINTDPTNGVLSGTAPNLTYTPDNGFVGDDSFTFTADDGSLTSSVATVAIRVGNNAPTTAAGPDQSLSLTGGTPLPATPGAEIFLDAGLDDGANSTWEDSTGLWNVAIDANVSFVADAGSAFVGITSAYDFPGGLSGSGGCEGADLEGLGVDNQSISLELWFRPDDSGTYPSNGQVLWETGGGTGLGIFYRNGMVETAHDSNAGQLSADVSGLTNEFIQVVVTFDYGSSTDNYKLYINGALEATGSRSDSDLSGSDNSGLGRRGQSNVGGAGNGDSSTESFDGKIAIFRSYHNQVLTDSEVLANYDSIAGGPAAVAALEGAVDDPDGNPLTITWSVVSTVPTNLSVVFSNASAASNSATFRAVGTYTLRLTADDGLLQDSDDIVITVGSNSTHTITATAGANGSLTPSGAVMVTDGADQLFTIAPNNHYIISLIETNGVSASIADPMGFDLTWSNVTAAGTLDVQFARRRTTAGSVPTAWLASAVPGSTNDYEAAVLLDPDNDGFLTWQEYWSGTDPMETTSHLSVDTFSFDGTNVVLTWRHAQVDADIPPLAIEMCTNLISGIWTSVGTNAPANGTNSWLGVGGLQQYYRLAATNAP